MKEVISLHFGQAGIQMGRQAWELFCRDHDILSDGTRVGDNPDELGIENEPFNSFFSETGSGQHIPRAIMADLDPSAMDDLRNSSSLGQVFHPGSLISFKQDSANNYAKGIKQCYEWNVVEAVMDRIRLAAELCDNLQGFFTYRSTGGGTGTSLGDSIMFAMLNDHDYGFKKKKKFETCINPSREYSSSVVEPYNCLLSTANSHELFDLTYMLDNQSAYGICKEKIGIKKPNFFNLNSILAQVVSLSTISLRHESELSATMDDICQNLVSEPWCRYPVVSLAPLRNPAKAKHENYSAPELVRELFNPASLLCDVRNTVTSHRWESATLIFRGETDQISAKAPMQAAEVYEAMRRLTVHPKSLKDVPQFVPWSNNLGVKVGIVQQPPIVPKGAPFATTKRQGALVGNSTAVREVFCREHKRFLKLIYNKSYLWHFLKEGLEGGEFDEAHEKVMDLISRYDDKLRACQTQENDAMRAMVENAQPSMNPRATQSSRPSMITRRAV